MSDSSNSDAALGGARWKIRTAAAALVLLAAIAFYIVWRPPRPAPSAEFIELLNSGKNYYDQGESAKALGAFEKAARIDPSDIDAQLDLANGYLLAGKPDDAARHAEEALQLDHNLAAAYYIEGAAFIRKGQFEPAVKALQTCLKFDANVAAANFELGLAEEGLQHWQEAIAAYQKTIALQPNHPSAHYKLGQALLRAGKPDEAAAEMAKHQALGAQTGGGAAQFERCQYTAARVPYHLEQPKNEGVPVKFTDVTASAFGDAGAKESWRGPVGVLDLAHDGRNGLLVCQGTNAFRYLTNDHGAFAPAGPEIPAGGGAPFRSCLVGDLNRDRSEDVIVLGPEGSRVFKTTTNGVISDVSAYSRLRNLAAIGGGEVDFDFTGKLDLMAVTATNSIRLFRILGGFMFHDITANSGIPPGLRDARQIVIDDWNNDDLMDLFVSRTDGAPLLFLKQRGGGFIATNFPAVLPQGLLASGDLNNDLRADLVIATPTDIVVYFNGQTNLLRFPHGMKSVRSLKLVDYDNDGWLDIVAAGDGIKVWRNVGLGGFRDQTAALGLTGLASTQIDSVTAADFDQDGDTDLLLALAPEALKAGECGLKLLRNDGGNANLQVKALLVGNRSNPSGIGVRIEIAAGGLHLIRTVSQLPVEIGVDQHHTLESMTVRWFDLAIPITDVQVTPTNLLTAMEYILPSGSCPNLYAWNGKQFQFVTDLLGAAPLGLPNREGHFIEADPDEYVRIGDEKTFPARGSDYTLEITEELREVLYLDEAKLAAVDHPAGTTVVSTDKLVPGKPFPPSAIVTLGREIPLRRATRPDGTDVTDLLRRIDGRYLSPPKLRAPQLRGLAEPHAVLLDFGPLPSDRPLALFMNGWLRFGGGMANIAAAQEPDLPFPFPTLDAEMPDGSWRRLDVVVGAPAGKTKSIVVDLSGKIPRGAGRLRLSEAFEIHWDKIALMERLDSRQTRIVALPPAVANLHWRGYSDYLPLPWYFPLTPDYYKIHPSPFWRILPAGWCTRYGPVNELLEKADDALVLIDGGDELTLRWPASMFPPKPEGDARDFFLYTVGWDKDSDFHVAHGWTVEPLPFHGMDDQRYGRQSPPPGQDRSWIEKYDTRWVGPWTLRLSQRRSLDPL